MEHRSSRKTPPQETPHTKTGDTSVDKPSPKNSRVRCTTVTVRGKEGRNVVAKEEEARSEKERGAAVKADGSDGRPTSVGPA